MKHFVFGRCMMFLGSYWLNTVARGDFVTLVVGSQEPSSEWVN